MSLTVINLTVPLAIGADGVARVHGCQASLDEIIAMFEDGAIADEIVARHPGLRLKDVFLVLAFYLEDRAQVEQYLRSRAESKPWRDSFPTVNWRTCPAA